jgi:hypothetical protein
VADQRDGSEVGSDSELTELASLVPCRVGRSLLILDGRPSGPGHRISTTATSIHVLGGVVLWIRDAVRQRCALSVHLLQRDESKSSLAWFLAPNRRSRAKRRDADASPASPRFQVDGSPAP